MASVGYKNVRPWPENSSYVYVSDDHNAAMNLTIPHIRKAKIDDFLLAML